jgi:shikimate kinase
MMIDGLIDDSEEAVLRRSHAEVRAARLDRHIVFVGFMGAGKSSLAKLTANKLGRSWFDSDQLVAKRAGRSIPEFFAAADEKGFRALEKQVILEVLDEAPAVLSLGGGALEDAETRRVVYERAFAIHLAIAWRDVQSGLPKLRRTRPLLQGRTESEIHELYLRRQMTYREAHIRIRMPRGDRSVAVDQLLEALAK